MATLLPGPLRTADISRFAQRGAQLEKVRPVIAYWCYYYVVQLIIQKGLHTEDDACMSYTTGLMDKLEQWKTEQAGNDAILDDTAAQAYCEQFAFETFQRAENTMRANSVTATTAETFRAASTFIDLIGVWHTPLPPELASKSKFAKYHAVRIAKALKEGQDPNASNPQQDQPIASPPPLDPNDPEVQKINSLQPTVEDVEDDSRPSSLQPQSTYRIPQPTVSASLPPQAAPQPHPGGDVSPLETDPSNEGYFSGASIQPSVPTFTAQTPVASLPTAPPEPPVASPQNLQSPPVDPQSFYTQNATQGPPPSIPAQSPAPSFPPVQSPHAFAPPTLPPPSSFAPQYPSQPPAQALSPSPNHFYQQPSAPAPLTQLTPSQPPSFAQAPTPASAQAPITAPVQQPAQPPGPEIYKRDDESIIASQKHAKWAISALSFEDVETAVKELRAALLSLGAR